MSKSKGILLVDKAPGSTSFQIVHQLRRLTRIDKIGHAGTLDPFATGVMVMLIGRETTQRSNEFLSADKTYRATLTLGIATDTYDCDGQVISQSDLIPTLPQIELALQSFQGTISQIPPMYSAKKIGGKKLYDLARRGITIERQPVAVSLKTTLLSYTYPHLEIEVDCSKGTYIRSLAHDLGQALGSSAHLSALTRLRSGPFTLEECIPQALLENPEFDITPHLRGCCRTNDGRLLEPYRDLSLSASAPMAPSAYATESEKRNLIDNAAGSDRSLIQQQPLSR